jgi:hypothetical protein
MTVPCGRESGAVFAQFAAIDKIDSNGHDDLKSVMRARWPRESTVG